MMTDSASDIPDSDLDRYGIRMMKIPIGVDGKGYLERESFTIPEFYPILRAAQEIPITSHIPAPQYEEAYERAFEDGYTHLINVTINSTGSNMYNSSRLGAEMFYENHPEARDKLSIYVVDSGTYTVAYGRAVIKAAQMAESGATVEEILSFLEEHFVTLEIYMSLYSLQFAKKSGRISAAAAFVGELLGLRPIMSLIDGKSQTLEKLRGTRQIPQRIVEIALPRITDSEAEILVVHGENSAEGGALAALVREQTGGKEIPIYQLGPSIVINTGPEVVGVIIKGQRRRPVNPSFGCLSD